MAYLEPLTSRRNVFHLVRTTAPRVEDGRVVPGEDHEVELVFHKLRDGLFREDGPATVVATFESRELEHMLQAIVDEAAKIGITASVMRDRDAEVRVLREHREDLRRIVFSAGSYEKLPT